MKKGEFTVIIQEGKPVQIKNDKGQLCEIVWDSPMHNPKGLRTGITKPISSKN